ncbi:MAG TPA: hypothetical protein VK272_10560 [Solirubrobacteraceae bacterium]|nr:hypothetical protein [Solirubrobacteraceae bacterium]
MLYAAHGLRLTSSFPFPGMPLPARSIGDDLLSLALTLRYPAELERLWSGACGPPEWRGRQGDGRDLVIERGSGGDLLFTYGELARFRLDPSMLRLDCAPRDWGLDWKRVLIGKVIPSISVMRGYEGLHAAAVDSPDGVVAIMAPSGSGKSTLALELLRRGWPLFADDALTLSQADGEVRAHPGTPHMNIAQSLPDGIDPQALGATIGVLAGERWLVARVCTWHPRPVRMLCLLERGTDLALELHALPANPVQLAPYMLGLSGDPERRASRFHLYANLIEGTPLVRLTAGLEHRPGQLADLVEQALAREPELVDGGVR